MNLYNRLSNEESIELLEKSGEDRLTLSFYKYFKIKNLSIFRNYLFSSWSKIGVLGRIYVAAEGINAQLSLPKKQVNTFITELDQIHPLKGVRLNFAIKNSLNSFLKLKIKVRNQIVVDGIQDRNFDPTNVGKHLNATEFNKILSEKGTSCIDMRNHYESEIGHFNGAITPNVDSFKESINFIDKKFENENKNKKILLYCTGGIRCEKASSLMKNQGFKNVYHLKGGILKYFELISEEQSKWEGECFVFDDRVSVKQDLSEGMYDMCHGCRMPITEKDKTSNKYIKGVSCSKCFDKTTQEQKSRYMSRQKQIDLAKKRNQQHIGPKEEVFN